MKVKNQSRYPNPVQLRVIPAKAGIQARFREEEMLWHFKTEIRPPLPALSPNKLVEREWF